MRRSRAEKAETHSRIVAVAARRFRERGIEGIGVADLMKDAGATTGGFYKHFESRDDLVIEALGKAFQELDDLEQKSGDLSSFLSAYLNDKHCANPGTGCAVTALAGDVRNASTGVRGVFTERVKRTLGYYADRLQAGDQQTRRSKAIMLFSAAVGGLTLARAVNDKSLTREIVASLREQLIELSEKSIPRDAPVEPS